MLRAALGVFRLTIAFAAVVMVTALILAAALLPVTRRGVRLSAWFTTWASQLAIILFNVRYRALDPDQVWSHSGFIFANHISYFDILMLQAILPLRYLSKAEVRAWPFIGWVAVAIGTVFVDRSSKASRGQARQQLVQAGRFPPIVLYPEGGIGPANSLQSFRYGAFEIAIEHGIPYLLCAIHYSRPDIIVWGDDENLMDCLWRLACFPGPIEASVVPLQRVVPQLGDDPKALAVQAHHTIAAALQVPPKMT
jgi:1-acyl-sn-glycerol-3-phosphate acyltransferase